MILQLDKKQMYLTVVTGPKEPYSPTDEIVKLFTEVDALRNEVIKFQKEVVQPALSKIEEEVQRINTINHPELKKEPTASVGNPSKAAGNSEEPT